jgi:asparagine synthase (glutamine-hydrolysing)
MCGIAGIHFKRDVDPGVLDRATAHFSRSLQHRGPDHFGVHRSARAVYVNLRLAIVDRATGQQPIYAPGRHLGIVYNGEVYNHDALRTSLAANWAFHTSSDTEVLLASWVAQGHAAFEQWNGMFAACLFDSTSNAAEGAFTLVRDRFGAKPLYIYEDEHCIAFASELRTLLGLEGLDHSLNPIGFQDYLAYRYNLAPHTQFKRIEKLPAGHWLRFAGGQRVQGRYAEAVMADGPAVRSEADYIEELDGLMSRAVSSQLMGEVPIGVLLSGGLDSSAIAAYVHKSGARLKAYSIGFPEVNEFAFSRDVARQYELDYVELTLTQGELREGMDEVIAQLDEPIADPACFALSRLCRTIREDVTVVLSGEGGDEMFAGYQHHQLALNTELSRNEVFGHFFVQSANHLDANQLLRDKALPLHHLRHRPSYDHNASALAGMQAFELATWMPENLMMKADKVLMAHSLEGRFPFLDLELYRFAATLPASMKLPHAESSKHVLRRLMAPQLPRSVIERRKMGFTVPPAFFLQPLQARLEDAIARLRGEAVAEVLDLDAALSLLRAFYAGQQPAVMKVWSLAVLLLWWADVYPTLRPRSQPALAPVEGPRQKLVVYTVLIGAKEALNDPLAELPTGSSTDLDIDWVCITDNPTLRSPTWRLERITDRHLHAEKLSRRAKALPHEYFPEVAHSLYIDNTVTMRRLPQASDLQCAGEYLFRAFRHATRFNPEEEAAAVAMLGYDDVATVCTQMDFYAERKPIAQITPLTTATVMLRSHHHPKVKRFGTQWWESILAFSKRDQLSFDFARQEAGVEIDYWPGTSENNPFVHWHGGLGRHRVQASFDVRRYAWAHRHDADALRDPKAHFLAHGHAMDSRWTRALPMFEFACWRQKSSLGSQVSPRRQMASAIEALLAPALQAGQRFLVVRVQDSAAPRAFSAAEHEAATAALSILMAKGVGTVLDLAAADFTPDGKIFTTEQAPYEGVIVLGLPGEQLEVATQKLIRLLDPKSGYWVAALTSPVPLQVAARCEQLIETTLKVQASTTLQASHHDDQREPLPNTVIGFAWAPAAPLPNTTTTHQESAA